MPGLTCGGRRRGCGGGPRGLAEGHSLARHLTERRSLRLPRRADCAFPSRCRPGGVGRNPPPACGALWKMGQLGKCARATPRQAAGGLRRGLQASAVGPDRTERRSRSVHRLTKMASRRRFRAFVYTVATRVALGDTSISTSMGCLRRRWSPASAGHPQHTKRRPDVRSMRLSGSFLSAYFGCPSRTLPLRCE